jgi:ferritin-like metal-binding protein YciE
METQNSVESLQELFLDELKDLYSAEKQITRALPKLVKAATSPKLKDAFQSHL